MELWSIYVLNLLLTLGMFVVLVFRAWIELKNFKVICGRRLSGGGHVRLLVES